MPRKAIEELRLAASGALLRLSPSSDRVQANKVVFSNHAGRGYGCNPKYIAEELLRRHGDALDLVWLCRSFDAGMPGQIRQVRFGSMDALRELSSAKVWVDNVRTRRHLKKKPEQFYLQTWHGVLGPKRVEADVAQRLSPIYIRGARQDSRDADLLIANNDFYEAVIRRSFWYEGEVLRCGMPRNAPLICPDEGLRERVRASVGIASGVKLCLFAPTFGIRERQGYDLALLDACRSALEGRFGCGFAFGFRLHPNDARFARKAHLAGAIDLSSYEDAQELLAATDVLITDYSSLAEDFALTGRPGYLYAPDVDDYQAKFGFLYPMEKRPYPFAKSLDELLRVIAGTADADFARKRDEFFAMVGLDDEGSGASVLADVLEAHLGLSS